MISPMILANTIYTAIDSFTSQSNAVRNYISQVYNEAGGQVGSPKRVVDVLPAGTAYHCSGSGSAVCVHLQPSGAMYNGGR